MELYRLNASGVLTLINLVIPLFLINLTTLSVHSVPGTNNQGMELVIKLIPNFELEREIPGFGAHLKVLAPESLKQKIRNNLLEAMKNYQKT